MCACECPKPQVPKLKWNPGHYMTLDSIRTSPDIRFSHFKQIAAIKTEPTVKGVKLWQYWGAVERAKGDYSAGFKIIDEYLAKLGPDKHLILSIQDRIFGGYAPADRGEYIPAWLQREQGYTERVYTSGRLTMARMWQAPTMNHYIAMLKALGARYNGHPNFQMMQVEETSVSMPPGADGYSMAAYGTQVRRMLQEVKPAWPNTILRLSTNFYGSDAQMEDMIRFCDTHDVAIGGPDIIPTETIQANRIYNAKLRGRMIWVAEVQQPSLGGKEGTFTPKQIYDTGMQSAPSHFLWIRNTWSGGAPQRWDSGILPFIRSINGAVNAACPANVEGCK